MILSEGREAQLKYLCGFAIPSDGRAAVIIDTLVEKSSSAFFFPLFSASLRPWSDRPLPVCRERSVNQRTLHLPQLRCLHSTEKGGREKEKCPESRCSSRCAKALLSHLTYNLSDYVS